MGIQKQGSVSFMALALSIAISMGASTSVALATIPVYLFSGPNQTISANVFGSPLVVKTGAQFAGAIYSLTWKGQEFIDRADHGRLLQSAVSYDGLGECLNPTEAGSRKDEAGRVSTSRLLSMSVSGNSLTAITQMAYWLEVGASYPQGCNGGTAFYSAQNIRNLSDDTIKKVVTIGSHGVENVIEYTVTLHVADHHTYTQFESLTGYMPISFRSFYTFDPASGALRSLSHTNGEQKVPVILATPDGSYAMGIYSPELPQSAYSSTGYGRFDFTGDGHPTTKWNAVYRMGETIPGDYTVHDFVIVGRLPQVQTSMGKLYTALSDKFSGTVTEAPRPPAPVTQDSTGTLMPVYRFYSPGTGEHFYSLSSTEGAAAGMRPEGIGFHVYQQESAERIALYRCIYGKHFVSRDADCEGFRNEGRYGFVDSKASNQNVPLYRFFNPANGDHLITKSENEGVNNHYREEGILGYVSP